MAPRSQKQRTDGVHGDYPDDWPEITLAVKTAAGWRCVRCGHPHDVAAGYMLTTHHLDMNKANVAWWNLAALCQRCHLSIQARVDFHQFYMLSHSLWLRPYLDGWDQFRETGILVSWREKWGNYGRQDVSQPGVRVKDSP